MITLEDMNTMGIPQTKLKHYKKMDAKNRIHLFYIT